MSAESKKFAEKFREVFDRAKGLIDAKSAVYEHADGSVSGWLTVSEPESIIDSLVDIENSLPREIPGAYMTVGYELMPSKRISREVFDEYKKHRGMAMAYGYPRRASRNGVVHAFNTAKRIWQGGFRRRGLRGAGWKKPSRIVVKFHFDPSGERPSRDEM